MTEQEIFEQARTLAKGEQRRFLIQICGRDSQKRQRIEDLLTAYQQLGSFLEMPAAGPETCDMPSVTEGPGCAVGWYKLLQRIGEGGFGVVYMAEQTEPVRRKVALKIIKPGMDTKEVIARFESERQALALMDHPNIARVLDAGATDSGRPYFVMELVRGVPITEFCDTNKLNINERMKLFVPVCLAVQHAHHKGIIHRDLKPSNVMVTLHDGVPVPKVIDFGVAKATSQQLTQRTLFTAYGQMIGTPLYMSPEQAEMSGLDIDTRSDIYSLGVLLYEMLTGTTPLEMKQLREAGFVEMQRLIREVEAPRPSTRLSTLRQDASIVCSKRGTDAKRLSDLLRGEVDWIVMKALEKDRQRRYDTPAAFANDIQRFLNHEAIEARPPSTAYRVQKFVQRNRRLAVGAACVGAALLLGGIVSTGLAIYANTQLAGRIAAESRLKNSLVDAQQERGKAIEERDRAVKAEEEQARQTALAEQRRIESEVARQAESEQRAIADQQRQQAEKLKEETIARNTQLQLLTEEQRRTIYASDMNLVRIEAQRGNLQRMREILMDQLPISGGPDLRGFEWYYWYRYLSQAKVLMKIDDFQFGKPGSAAAVVPGGELVAVTAGKTTKLQNIETGIVVGSIPEPLRLLVQRTRFSETGRSIHGEANSNDALWLNYPRVNSDGFSVYEPTGEKRSFEYPTDSFSHVSFLNISRDGKRVVALGNAKEYTSEQPVCRVIVWDVESNAIVLNHVLSRRVNRVEFSPDGMRMAAHLCKGPQLYSNEYRDVVVVMDVSTGEELGVAQHNDEIDSLFWLPDCQRLLLGTLSFSGPNRKELLSWTIGQARPTRLSHELIPDYVKGSVSPDGRLIAITGHTTSSIRIFDTASGDIVDTLHHEATTIDTVTFSKDGQRIVACSTSGTMLAWNLSQKDLFALRTQPLPRLASDGFAINPDQSLIAYVTHENKIHVRTREKSDRELKIASPVSQATSWDLTFSPNSRFLVCLSNSSGQQIPQTRSTGRSQTLIKAFDLQSGDSEIWSFSVPAAVPGLMDGKLTFSPDSNHAWINSQPQGVLLKCDSGEDITPQSLRRIPQRAPIRTGLPVQSDGRLLLLGAELAGQGLFLHDAVTGDRLLEIRHPSPYQSYSTRLSPDGAYVGFCSSRDSLVSVWNVKLEKQMLETNGSAVVFSSDGKRAAISVGTEIPLVELGAKFTVGIESVSLWDISTGRRLSNVILTGDKAQKIQFSPDSQRLLTLHGVTPTGSGGLQPQGRLWDVESGRELFSIPVANVNHYNWNMLFDKTGRQLTCVNFGKYAGSGSGGEARVYDATPLPVDEDAQLIAGRLIDRLSDTACIPEEFKEGIEAVAGLPGHARMRALKIVEQMQLDRQRVALNCLGIVINDRHSATTYQQALRRSKSLIQAEPNSQSANWIFAAALHRNGKHDEALAILEKPDSSFEGDSRISVKSLNLEFLRDSIRLLARKKVGTTQGFLPLVSEFRKNFERADGGADLVRLRGTHTLSFLYLYSEVRNSLSFEFSQLSRQRALQPAELLKPVYFDDEAAKTYALQADANGRIILDANKDGQISVAESSGKIFVENFRLFDYDGGGTLSYDEYQNYLNVRTTVQRVEQAATSLIAMRLPFDETLEKLAVERLNEAIERAPGYAPAWRMRAWLSVSMPGKQRNAAQSLADATQACELSQRKDALALESLAAAHAAAGDFNNAIQNQEQSLPLHNAAGLIRARARLALYEKKKTILDADQHSLRILVHSSLATTQTSATNHPPLISWGAWEKSRRFTGETGGSISAGGNQLILSHGSPIEKSELLAVDLSTGFSRRVFSGGVRPVWSHRVDGPIAFLRIREGQPPIPASQEVWLVNSDGSNARKISDGGSLSMTEDGTLYFYTFTDRNRFELCSINVENRESQVTRRFEVDGFPIVSRDGRNVAYVIPGHVVVRSTTTGDVIADLPFHDKDGAGFVTWSPDSRFLCYNAATNSGVWLIEPTTAKWRLLADSTALRAHWSPDGKLISIESGSEIVVLTLGGLDLEKEFAVPAELAMAPSFVAKAATP